MRNECCHFSNNSGFSCVEESISNDAANGPRCIGDEGTAGRDADGEMRTQHRLLQMENYQTCLQTLLKDKDLWQNFCPSSGRTGHTVTTYQGCVL